MFMEHSLYHEKWAKKCDEDLNTESNKNRWGSYISPADYFHGFNSTLSSREIDVCKIQAKSMTRSFRNLIQICTLELFSVHLVSL